MNSDQYSTIILEEFRKQSLHLFDWKKFRMVGGRQNLLSEYIKNLINSKLQLNSLKSFRIPIEKEDGFAYKCMGTLFLRFLRILFSKHVMTSKFRSAGL